jgi:hypothetical protein
MWWSSHLCSASTEVRPPRTEIAAGTGTAAGLFPTLHEDAPLSCYGRRAIVMRAEPPRHAPRDTGAFVAAGRRSPLLSDRRSAEARGMPLLLPSRDSLRADLAQHSHCSILDIPDLTYR